MLDRLMEIGRRLHRGYVYYTRVRAAVIGAAHAGNVGEVERLLTVYADFMRGRDAEACALTTAAVAGRSDVVRLILDRGHVRSAGFSGR